MKICLANSDCRDGYCKLGTCTAPSEYLDPCDPSGPEGCGAGSDDLVCSDHAHLCVTDKDERAALDGDECDSNIHCHPTHYCPTLASAKATPSGSKRKCARRLDTGAECQNEQECADGRTCWKGFCRRRVLMPGTECRAEEQALQVPDARYGICVPGTRAPKSAAAGGDGLMDRYSKWTLLGVGMLVSLAVLSVVGLALLIAQRKGWIGRDRRGSKTLPE